MADNQQILKLIEETAREGGKELNLKDHQLTSLPPEIGKLTSLTNLNLGNNQLKGLPAEITKLSNLTNLILSRNQLGHVPPEIFQLSKLTNLVLSNNQLERVPGEITNLIMLTSLDLSANRLTIVPPEITKLTKLSRLDLNRNELTSVPPEITNLTNLTHLILSNNQLKSVPLEITELTNLTSLDLSNDQLTSLPPEITKLVKLANLVLSNNQLTSVPHEITNLTMLTSLDLSNNQLTSVPHEIINLTNLTNLVLSNNPLARVPLEITKLTKLISLDLSNDQLTSIPPDITKLTNLTRLVLSHNQLLSVPVEITQLSNLTRLVLSNNKLSIPPETLAKSFDVKAIFAAIAGLKSGDRLNEAKMLVVGDGKVGKSSVVERLIYGTFDPNKQTTLGVEINDEMKVVQNEMKGEGEPIKLNIWDFGGQEIQHSTHRFFLSTRSLYLLVLDARKGDQISNTEYWLKLIESFGGDSPIIIVINQIDQLKGQRPLNVDRRALQAKYNIRDFVETSCETAEGIQDLKEAIVREVEQLKHVRDVWPREWIAVKERLKGMQKDYIPVERYLEICDEENLKDEDVRRSLLGLLHDIGIVIRFPGDMQVLNPRWVTQGVYGVLTSTRLVETQGQFDLQEMDEILVGVPKAKTRYPSHTHRRLVDVMRHFELCFEFTDRQGHYLIPRHLHDDEPNNRWDDSNSLQFQYHYDTLPDSVISRVIVRMSQYLTDKLYWKSGVYLHTSENRARIKADPVDGKIFVSINGKEQTRRAFLAVIRSAFDEINSNFKIEIKQMIPVPGSPQVLISYQDLLAYEEMNERQIVIPELRKKCSVRDLLDFVEDPNTRMERRERDGNERRSPKMQSRIFRIVVASPADVQSERQALSDVIDEVNHGVAADRSLHLVLARWETDAYPGFHLEGPQGLIDPILRISDCDLLIGVFWTRFGTTTVDGKTGTEHEFGLAHEAWQEKGSPQIFVYFNQKSYTADSKAETEQWGRVLEFKEKFPTEGLWWPYKGKAQFEKLVRKHLTNYIRTLT